MAYTYAEFQGYLHAIGQERHEAVALQASLAGVQMTRNALSGGAGPASPASRFSATPGAGESMEF